MISDGIANIAHASHAALQADRYEWESYLKELLRVIGSGVGGPSIPQIQWGTITGSVPLTWGAGFQAPGALTVPSDSIIADGPSAPTLGDVAWIYTKPTDYVPALKSAVQTKLGAVLAGAPVLGHDYYQGLADKAKSEAALAFTAELETAGNAFGMRAELPVEGQLAAGDAAVGKYRAALQEGTLAALQQEAKDTREDVWKAVDAAQAFEQVWSAFWLSKAGQELEIAVQSLKADIESNRADIDAYTAQWAAVKTKADAWLGLLQAQAIPGEQHIKAETVRLQGELQQMQLAVSNADLEFKKGNAQAELVIKQLQFAAEVNNKLLETLAMTAANAMSGYLGAGQVHIGMSAGASDSSSVSDSTSRSQSRNESHDHNFKYGERDKDSNPPFQGWLNAQP